MATDLTPEREASDITDPHVSPVERPTFVPTAGESNAHRTRFIVIYTMLAAVLGLAIAGAVIYGARSIKPAAAWSTWHPDGGGLGAAKQIAEHIAPAYRLPDGTQIVDVIPRGPEVVSAGQTIPVPFIVLRGPEGKVLQNTITQVSNSNTLTYSLCGEGTACAIATGKPTVQRGTLVRREILELALYTFKYVHGVSNVVAFMPPPAGSKPTYAVYLKRSDLSQELGKPLARTLSLKVPLPNQIRPAEQQTIDALTESRVFKFGLLQTQQGDAVLALDPLQS